MTLPCILYNCFVFALFFILKILDLRAYHKIGLMNKISKTHCIVIDAILTAIILCVAAFLSAIVFLKPDDGYSFPLSFLIIPWSLACLLFALSLFVERRKSMTIGITKIPASYAISSLIGISVFIPVYYYGNAWLLSFLISFLGLSSEQWKLNVSYIAAILFQIVLVAAFCLIKWFYNSRISKWYIIKSKGRHV